MSRDNNQTGPVDQNIDDLYNSRNENKDISIKVYSTTSKSKHMRHSSINELSNSPGSFIRSSESKSSRSINKNMKASNFNSNNARNPSKNRVKKYYDRATRLSPRSWIKKKNSLGKDPRLTVNHESKVSVVELKRKGLENIASRLSLVSVV